MRERDAAEAGGRPARGAARLGRRGPHPPGPWAWAPPCSSTVPSDAAERSVPNRSQSAINTGLILHSNRTSQNVHVKKLSRALTLPNGACPTLPCRTEVPNRSQSAVKSLKTG